MKVGDLLWNSNATSVVITGETRVSWIIGKHSWSQIKVSKKAIAEKGHDGSYWPSLYSTQKAAEDKRFLLNNRHEIGRLVQGISDVDLIRKIAELVEFVDERGTQR